MVFQLTQIRRICSMRQVGNLPISKYTMKAKPTEPDVPTRETMFLSGFVRDLVECGTSVISDDQIHWLINQGM